MTAETIGSRSGDEWPAVTVIVPVHGDRGGIRATAAALARQDYPGTVEVVVVDNGDNEGLEEVMTVLPGARIVEERAPGSYAARNTGLRAATGDVLAFTDADCQPRPDWLRRGVEVLLGHADPVFVGGAVDVFGRNPSRPTLAELWDSVNCLRQDRYVRDAGWAATANMITTRGTMTTVGPFDARLRSGGDREWGERAVSRGARAVYAPEAVVDHPARTMTEQYAKIRRVTRGTAALRRSQGLPTFAPGQLVAALRPNVRSSARASVAVADSWTPRRLGYVAVSLWLQYYNLGATLYWKLTERARPDGTPAVVRDRGRVRP